MNEIKVPTPHTHTAYTPARRQLPTRTNKQKTYTYTYRTRSHTRAIISQQKALTLVRTTQTHSHTHTHTRAPLLRCVAQNRKGIQQRARTYPRGTWYNRMRGRAQNGFSHVRHLRIVYTDSQPVHHRTYIYVYMRSVRIHLSIC